MPDAEFAKRLNQHLSAWVGQWPPVSAGVHVVGHPARLVPTWDGSIRPLLGVGNGSGTVISVPPGAVDAIRTQVADGLGQPELGNRLGAILGIGDAAFGTGVFRTTAQVNPDIEELGEWFDEYRPELPAWLAPFNGPLLVARDDDGRPIAGVGIKIHDALGYELSVVTEPIAEGRGLGRRLVATAARWILDQGNVPTYLHAPTNLASARVAEAVGFTDEGWTIHGLWQRP